MTAVAFTEVGLKRGRAQVLSGASWRLEPGEFHVIAGASGAGATSVLELCALALPADAGEVRVLGETPAPDAPGATALRRRIGWAPQVPRFLERMSLVENVALPLRLTGRPPSLRLAQAAELLDWVGLGDRADDLPGALSAGERRRAGLARAVVAGPELILADEPSGDLDPVAAERALEMLAALAAHGAAVATASRSAEWARLAGHRAGAKTLTLEGGRLRPGRA